MKEEDFIKLIGTDASVDYYFIGGGEMQEWPMSVFELDEHGEPKHKWLPLNMDIFIEMAELHGTDYQYPVKVSYLLGDDIKEVTFMWPKTINFNLLDDMWLNYCEENGISEGSFIKAMLYKQKLRYSRREYVLYFVDDAGNEDETWFSLRENDNGYTLCSLWHDFCKENGFDQKKLEEVLRFNGNSRYFDDSLLKMRETKGEFMVRMRTYQ